MSLLTLLTLLATTADRKSARVLLEPNRAPEGDSDLWVCCVTAESEGDPHAESAVVRFSTLLWVAAPTADEAARDLADLLAGLPAA